jgi:hypothetical protein
MLRRAGRLLACALLLAPLPAPAAEVALSFSEAPGGVGAGFRIERREAESERFAPIALVGPGVSDFVDRGLPREATYCYRVRSLATGDPAGWSPEVCAVAEDPPPVAPEGAGAPPAGGGADAASPPPAEGGAAGETSPAEGSAGTGTPAPAEPSPAAGAAEPGRIRTSGGWLQVLD